MKDICFKYEEQITVFYVNNANRQSVSLRSRYSRPGQMEIGGQKGMHKKYLRSVRYCTIQVKVTCKVSNESWKGILQRNDILSFPDSMDVRL